MAIGDLLHGAPPNTVPASHGGPGPVPVPGADVERVLQTVKQYMPLIEEITGIQRRELFIPVLKIGLRGKFDGLLDSLGAGKPSAPALPEMRIIKIGKFVVLWGSLAVFLFGAAIIGLLALSRILLVSL